MITPTILSLQLVDRTTREKAGRSLNLYNEMISILANRLSDRFYVCYNREATVDAL